MVKKDYTEHQSVWVKGGIHRNQVASFVESKGPSFAGIELLDGRRVKVKWSSIMEIFCGPCERNTIRDIERPGEWVSALHYEQRDGRTVNIADAEDEIRRQGAWRPQNANQYYLAYYRELRTSDDLRGDNQRLRGENRMLHQRLLQMEDRVQQIEELLHNSNIPSGF
ncbi:unknown protein [Seminavis robusta]|uniref:Uncharacterized protein n=1 Tax=Seminavis robusta TaxID=568900 RepID=A0A9N8EG48_9STRA|nr:unknown protein [Seminavis robusta]|eukprot:Sro1139_g245470.1 n/a (167) ;mRNA; r:27038-27538